jgi:hypothetical protein
LDTFATWLEQNPSQTAKLNPENHSICMHVRPQKSDLMRLMVLIPSIRYLGVGGGPAFSVWNGQTQLFKSPLDATIRPIQYLMDVSSMTDQDLRGFEFIVCAPPNSQLSGLVVSFWSDADMQELCPPSADRPQTSATMPRFSINQDTGICLGTTTLIR